MKNYFFLLLLLVSVFVACNKESMAPENTPTLSSTDVEPILRQVAPPPDLIISLLDSDLPGTTMACNGVELPNAHCSTGSHDFNLQATVKNQGVGDLPAGNLEIIWSDSFSGNSYIVAHPHNGIAAQDSVQFSRPYYLGPCDCTGLPRCYTHTFQVGVDPNNLISESDETNNNSDIYEVCDGCGYCLDSDVEPIEPVEGGL